MKKYLIIGVPIILLIAVVSFLLLHKNATDTETVPQENKAAPVSLPSSTANDKTTESVPVLGRTDAGKLVENTTSGPVTINDFVKGAEVADNGVIYPVIKKNYSIGYNSTDDEFIITLLATDGIEATRKEAENDLLAGLGIAKDDACKLKTFLYVSAALTTDDSLSRNHGLSFCPGSKPFPN